MEGEQAVTYPQLLLYLQDIARTNHDEFKYRIDIDIRRDGFHYSLVASESADNHDFFSTEWVADLAYLGSQETLEDLRDACKHWSYTVPKSLRK